MPVVDADAVQNGQLRGVQVDIQWLVGIVDDMATRLAVVETFQGGLKREAMENVQREAADVVSCVEEMMARTQLQIDRTFLACDDIMNDIHNQADLIAKAIHDADVRYDKLAGLGLTIQRSNDSRDQRMLQQLDFVEHQCDLVESKLEAVDGKFDDLSFRVADIGSRMRTKAVDTEQGVMQVPMVCVDGSMMPVMDSHMAASGSDAQTRQAAWSTECEEF